MLVVHVHVHVKPECVASFCQATKENARQSIREPGIVRFDVVPAIDTSFSADTARIRPRGVTLRPQIANDGARRRLV